MLMLRSAGVLESGTWGNCGGAHKATETPLNAATREGREETGYRGEMEMIPLLVFSKGDFRYSNFLAVVEDEFTPDLGWEADDSCWVDFGDWPSPLHFGMKALFSDAMSVAKIKALVEG
jgi:8-oxo-dGTP pyrophosphatase MutT (NUDIX family)